jgi:HK97 family phage major capsid protein
MTRTRQRDGTGWYRITNITDGPAQILLYDVIGASAVTAQDFLHELSGVNGPVEIHINSPGGDVFDCYAIYNALVSRPGVTTVVDSLAASAASVIAMAGEQRLMAKTSQLMIHDAWAPGSQGGSADLRHMADRLDTVSGQIAGVYADTAGGEVAYWRGLMRDETWFTPQEALDVGLITGIVDTAREVAPAAASVGARSGIVAVLTPLAWDPDGDGDDDSTPDTDTDHSHWDENGKQLKSVPGRPMPGQPPAEQPTPNDSIEDANVDNSPWDASKAWANGAASDNPASFYAGICAGKKAGDKSTQAAWALPYRYHPGDPPNAAGVRNALSRLPQTQGLTNAAEAKSKLETLMKRINPDWTPSSQAASTAGAPATNGRTGTMPEDQGALTIESRRSRNTEIAARLQDIAATYPASQLPAEVQAEWDQISAERKEHQAALDAVEARNAELAQILAADTSKHDVARPQDRGNGQRPGGPAVHVHGDIYDLGAIRQRAHNVEELPGLYRDNAIRAIEEHRFFGTTRYGMTRETAQANVEKMLYLQDDMTGVVARRVLATGSQEYLHAYNAALKAGRVPAGRAGEILNAIGDGTQGGGLAVPFQLDPTMILVSNGAINPLRQISRVEQITGKEFDLVTSTGVTVSRKAEFAVETDNSPTLLQPTIQPKRVSGWVPFSVELEGDWSGLQASMMALLADAKDVEESNSFTLGAGTGVTAGGVVTTATNTVTLTGGVATLSFKDPETLESAMAPRFRTQASYLASKTTYNKYRNLFAAQTGFATDPWNRPTLAQPRQLWGYDAYEDSDMVTTNATGDKVLVMGDFGHGFLIVDRVGMNVELVPTVFGAAQGNLPTGTRGYYAWWRNNSIILIQNAIRVGVVG